MALRGDLASVDLAQVFQMLALNKKVGLLSIQSDSQRRVLYFDERGVTVHHNPHRLLERVVASAVRSGRVDEASVEDVRDHSVRTGHSLGESLLAGGYLQPEELDELYQVELEEEVYDLFFCRDAKFEFHERATELEGWDGVLDERFFFNCDSVIMEAARRIDEWAYICDRIPSTAEVLFAAVDLDEGDDYGVDGPAIHALLDGRRSVERVAQLTGLTTFQVCKPLSQMLDAGVVEVVAADELVPLGDECLEDGRIEDAISLYERAVSAGELDAGAHARAAQAYEAAEQFEAAVRHLDAEAERSVAAEDLAAAAGWWNQARLLLPTHLGVRQRLLELCVGPAGVSVPGYDPLQEGRELVDLLTQLGDLDRVRGLLEQLLLAAPHDPDLKKALVNVHVRAGDQKRVVQLYESIADDLVQQNKPLEAVSYLQKILLLDRGRTDISERVRSLYEFDERARRRSRALSALAGVFCLLVVLGAGFWFYNERAEEDLVAIDVTAMVATDDFAGAKARYADFIAAHPLTTAVPKAEAELQKIESAQQMFDARRASERAARDAHLRGLRTEYRRLWGDQRELLAAGELEQAMAAMTRVRALVREAGAPEDLEWAHEQKVQSTWKNLGSFLERAVELGDAYDVHLAAGEYSKARVLALQLQSEFAQTAAGKRARVPVTVTTRPVGARLSLAGAALTRTVDGREEPLLTPGVVLCELGAPLEVTAELDGFEPQQIVVDGRAAAEVTAVMAVVPERVVSFGAPAQTGVGVGGGWLAVGLRGGRLGVARTDGSAQRVLELGGLKAVAGTPVVAGGRVFFTSNEGAIESVPLESGVRAGRFPVQLAAEAVTPLVSADGRLLVVDGDNILRCWEQSTGRPLWQVDLDAAPAGPPSIVRRRVYVGAVDGRVLVFDLADGAGLGVLRSPSGVTTGVHVEGDLLVFGCADQAVRVVDLKAGDVCWTRAVDRIPGPGDLAVLGDRVCIATADGVVVCDRERGEEVGRVLGGEPALGLQVQAERLFARVTRAAVDGAAAHEVLVALDVVAVDLHWEFGLSGAAPGPLGVDGLHAAMPTPEGDVVLFR